MQAVDASVVIAPYLEPVVRGRRVAIFGDATRPLGPALLERGARLVHVYDPDAARVAEVLALRGSSRTLMTAPLPEGDVAVRDGAFDAVVVPDLTIFDPVDAIVAQARRLVASHGHAVFASPNPEALPEGLEPPSQGLLSYYELYDVIALQFPEVRMLGQAPFAGYVIADFAPEGEPDVVVDTSLVEREAQEPRWFLALGTQQPRRLDPYTIIQVPGGVGDGGVVDAAGRRKLQERVASLEKALEEAKSAVPIVPRVPAVNERVEALEASLREKEEALRRAEGRAGDNHVRAGRLEGKVRDLEEELRHQRDRAFRLSNELEEEKKQRTKADLELRMVRSKSEMPPAKDEGASGAVEAERLERALEQANDQIAKLESELAAARTRLAETERSLASSRDELDDLIAAKTQAEARVIELKREVAGRDARIEELDSIVVDLQEATGDAELEQALEQARIALSTAQTELETVRTEREDLADSLRVVTRARDDARALVQARERELVQARQQLEQAPRTVVDSTALEEAHRQRDEALASVETMRGEQEREIGALERTLRDRGREIQRLRGVIAHHERLVRELVVRLEEPGGAQTDVSETEGAWRQRHAELSAAFARQEGELQNARWKVAELEHKVRDQDATVDTSSQTTELEHALFAAQNELDALRQALAAERDARLRAENGAVRHEQDRQADVQEQTVLDESVEGPTDPSPDAG